MDPLSIAASVTTLAVLVKEVGLGAVEYYKGVKHADRQALEFGAELEALKGNLDRLGQFLASHTNEVIVFNDNSVLRSSIKACSTKLSQLQPKLESTQGIRRRLKWPFDEKEHREGMTLMKTLSQLIHLSLTIDSLQLLSQTATDLPKILGLQLEQSQELKKIEEHTHQIHNSLEEQSQLLTADEDARYRRDILQWLSAYDPMSKHEFVRDPRVEGTGMWLLECHAYKAWRDGFEQPNALWCHGIPGSGKSVLTSLVVDELKKSFASPQTPLAYVYLDYRDTDFQKPATLIAGILKQILSAMTNIPSSIVNLYESSKHSGSKLQISEVQQALVETCTGLQKTYIVLDALDEVAEWSDRYFLFTTIQKLREITRVRFFMTSRSSHEDIQGRLSDVPQLVIKAQESDLRTYLNKRIRISRAIAIMDTAFQEEVIDTITHRAQGMFLLPELQIRSVLDQPTKGHMKKALQSLPNNLRAALAKTIDRIQSQPEYFSRLGMEALMWVSHAKMPLTATDLCTALAIQQSVNRLDKDFMPSVRFVIESCFGLLMVNEEDDLIRPCHFSVQEYLQDHNEELFASAELQITSTCLKYLAFEPFRSGPTQTSHDLKDRARMNTFALYATCAWPLHGRLLEDDSSVTMMLDFISDADVAASAHQLMQFALGYQRAYHTREESYSCTPLHFASLVGLLKAVQRMLDSGEYDVNAETRMGTTSLTKAASRNHAGIVRVLLQHGAELTRSNRYGNALHCAAEAGACNTIPVLIEAGLDINCERPGIHRTPLHCTVDNDFHAAASLLLDLGANIYAEDKYGSTALEYAVETNARGVILTLLKRGYNLNFRGAADFKPILHHLAESTLHLNVSIIALLMEYGADLDARRGDGGDTLLLRAVRNSSVMNVACLALMGADTSVRTAEGMTVVELAESVLDSRASTQYNDPPISQVLVANSLYVTRFVRDKVSRLSHVPKGSSAAELFLYNICALQLGTGVAETLMQKF